MLKRLYPVLLSAIALVAICYRIFSSDYAFTDEAHLLWHHRDGANFRMFLEQGRIITALIIQRSFSSITTIAQLKWLRIISFAGWLVTIGLWHGTLSAWGKRCSLHPFLITFMTIFLPCSLTVGISIGWAACMELSLGFSAALLSGHIFFKSMHDQQKISIASFSLSLVLAMISLFTYQPMFGAFLLPFFMLYAGYRKFSRTMVLGITTYLAFSLLYYFLFKYTLHLYAVPASDRTAMATDPFEKLSFFISQPLPQAFSFNFLYNLSGIFSQVFFPLMLAGWVLSVFLIDKGQRPKEKLVYILAILGVMILIYLPGLLTRENFASYRTMLPLNLAGTFLLFDTGWRVFNTVAPKWQSRYLYILCTIVLFVGWYSFNINFIDPLRSEYKAIRVNFKDNYAPAISKVIFIRPPETLFGHLYGIHHYKDEYGVPSTYKDWTPEPLLRQLVLEATGSYEKAIHLQITNIARDDYHSSPADHSELIMDIPAIMKQE